MGIDYNQMEGGYDKFVRGDLPIAPEQEPIPTMANKSIGQEKYAKRGYYDSIYEDESRNTADDMAADNAADTTDWKETDVRKKDISEEEKQGI